jgi:hypothetical protein
LKLSIGHDDDLGNQPERKKGKKYVGWKATLVDESISVLASADNLQWPPAQTAVSEWIGSSFEQFLNKPHELEPCGCGENVDAF